MFIYFFNLSIHHYKIPKMSQHIAFISVWAARIGNVVFIMTHFLFTSVLWLALLDVLKLHFPCSYQAIFLFLKFEFTYVRHNLAGSRFRQTRHPQRSLFGAKHQQNGTNSKLHIKSNVHRQQSRATNLSPSELFAGN